MSFILELSINLIYFLFSLILPSKLKEIDTELTRKLSHMLCGSWIFISAFVNNYYLTNIVSIVFMLFLMGVSYKYNIFKGIERAGQKKSYGTIYFFLSLLIYLVYAQYFQISSALLIVYFLPLIYGDAFAALFGKGFQWHNYQILGQTKSISGNIAMFIVSYMSILFYNYLFLGVYNMSEILLISIIATVIEAVSVKGTDNFTIPIVTYIIIMLII